MQTGDGIISPTSRLLIEQLLFKNVLHFHKAVQNWFSKQAMELSKKQIELFLPLLSLWSKNFVYKMFHIFPKEFEINSQNMK